MELLLKFENALCNTKAMKINNSESREWISNQGLLLCRGLLLGLFDSLGSV
jgi:hypothetical protein